MFTDLSFIELQTWLVVYFRLHGSCSSSRYQTQINDLRDSRFKVRPSSLPSAVPLRFSSVFFLTSPFAQTGISVLGAIHGNRQEGPVGGTAEGVCGKSYTSGQKRQAPVVPLTR